MEQVINIGSGRSIKINHLAKLLIKATGRTSLRPVYHPFREGEILHSRANIQLAQRVLSYTPTVPLEKGLKQYVDWIRSVHEY